MLHVQVLQVLPAAAANAAPKAAAVAKAVAAPKAPPAAAAPAAAPVDARLAQILQQARAPHATGHTAIAGVQGNAGARFAAVNALMAVHAPGTQLQGVNMGRPTNVAQLEPATTSD